MSDSGLAEAILRNRVVLVYYAVYTVTFYCVRYKYYTSKVLASHDDYVASAIEMFNRKTPDRIGVAYARVSRLHSNIRKLYDNARNLDEAIQFATSVASYFKEDVGDAIIGCIDSVLRGSLEENRQLLKKLSAIDPLNYGN